LSLIPLFQWSRILAHLKRGEVMRRMMLDTALAAVAACGVNSVPDTVLFVVVDADEGEGWDGVLMAPPS
jgi:hypothetical protein